MVRSPRSRTPLPVRPSPSRALSVELPSPRGAALVGRPGLEPGTADLACPRQRLPLRHSPRCRTLTSSVRRCDITTVPVLLPASRSRHAVSVGSRLVRDGPGSTPVAVSPVATGSLPSVPHVGLLGPPRRTSGASSGTLTAKPCGGDSDLDCLSEWERPVFPGFPECLFSPPVRLRGLRAGQHSETSCSEGIRTLFRNPCGTSSADEAYGAGSWLVIEPTGLVVRPPRWFLPDSVPFACLPALVVEPSIRRPYRQPSEGPLPRKCNATQGASRA